VTAPLSGEGPAVPWPGGDANDELAGFEYQRIGERRLDNEIRDDAMQGRGSLPLLQILLRQMAERRRGKTLTFLAYEELGGLGGVAASQAEAVMADLGVEAHDEVFRTTFVRLVTNDPEAPAFPVGRRVGIDVFEDGGREMLEAFVRAGVILVSRNEETGRVEVEFAHPGVVRNWEPIRMIHSAYGEFFGVRDRVEELQALMPRDGRGGLRLVGPPLQALEELERRCPEMVTPAMRADLRAARLWRWRQGAVYATGLLGVVFALVALLRPEAMREPSGERRRADTEQPKEVVTAPVPPVEMRGLAEAVFATSTADLGVRLAQLAAIIREGTEAEAYLRLGSPLSSESASAKNHR